MVVRKGRRKVFIASDRLAPMTSYTFRERKLPPFLTVLLSKFVAAGALRQLLPAGPAQRWVQREHRAHALVAQNASEGSQRLRPLQQSSAKADQPGS